MSKILTLVIPTYNMQDYLPECLESLIMEENLLALLEVLIVIDGATDNSAQIGQNLAQMKSSVANWGGAIQKMVHI